MTHQYSPVTLIRISSKDKYIANLTVSMAEKEGFEPSIGVTYTPLAGERLRPLGHFSFASVYI